MVQACPEHVTVAGSIVRDKALYITAHLEVDNFMGSIGCIDRFNRRHNIVYSSVSQPSLARGLPFSLIYLRGPPPLVDAVTYEKKLLYFHIVDLYTVHICTMLYLH